MKIVPKTRKGRNKINKGLTDNVVVILESHQAHPPAVLVAPSTEPSIK